MARIAANHASVCGGVVLARLGQCAMAGIVLSQFKFGVRHPGTPLNMNFMIAGGLGQGVDVILFHDWLCGPNVG